ncbi:class I SAM-dependent methyltransferase [Desulfobacter vibrioformis]|uniref:class I SAM-dependent methyltransferase n=1 Tax=Desulfobacter vibrioformis TaxID=34031 RepID=UPI000558770A|nr:class I SAM-dependent methyltransferase [Desulfobacter vibrioformis]
MKNSEYWKKEGVQKVFTHPLCDDWIASLDKNACVLDLGCGYGRLTPVLQQAGFSNIVGYDSSPALLDRARKENPGAFYSNVFHSLSGRSFNLILCFALFTSAPSLEEQKELVSLIEKVCGNKTYLYISDYETCDNPAYQTRYQERRLNMYGCFASGNAIFRHHKPGHFDTLFPEWRKLKEKTLKSRTLNGNEIIIHQYLYIRSQ